MSSNPSGPPESAGPQTPSPRRNLIILLICVLALVGMVWLAHELVTSAHNLDCLSAGLRQCR